MKFEKILEWYSGKALDIIRKDTIPTLERCEEQGFWLKGVTRKVKAQLNKMTAAQKWSRACEKTFGEHSYGSFRMPSKHPLLDVQHAMMYGLFERAPKVLQELLAAKVGKDRQLNEHLPAAIAWAQAFTPVAHLVALLDERRPKQTVVFATLSPTVAKNISGHIGIDIATIRSPEMVGEWVEYTITIGGKPKTIRVWRVRVVWPEGTLHNKSKFFHSGENWQCQACGHAIKNPFNWVPILAYGWAKPAPSGSGGIAPAYSLIVGRDCAEKLFGCKVEGDMLIENR